MKKFLILILLLFLTFISTINITDDSQFVMSVDLDNSNYYELIFDEELLNFRNFKLKLSFFSSYEYNITKVYIKYTENVKDYFKNKEYFSFDNTNFNIGIERLKKEYTKILKDNYLYTELDKDINDVQIYKVDLYCDKDALTKLKIKFPKIKIKKLLVNNL